MQIKDFGSVVPKIKYTSDPQTLLYHMPSMPAVKYARLSNTYQNYTLLLKTEQLAKQLGYLLVSAECIHYRRRQKLIDDNRRIKLSGRSWYTLRPSEMTKSELIKHKIYIQERELD